MYLCLIVLEGYFFFIFFKFYFLVYIFIFELFMVKFIGVLMKWVELEIIVLMLVLFI